MQVDAASFLDSGFVFELDFLLLALCLRSRRDTTFASALGSVLLNIEFVVHSLVSFWVLDNPPWSSDPNILIIVTIIKLASSVVPNAPGDMDSVLVLLESLYT